MEERIVTHALRKAPFYAHAAFLTRRTFIMATWLKDAIFYEIYPQSFNDTNGDGIGAFN